MTRIKFFQSSQGLLRVTKCMSNRIYSKDKQMAHTGQGIQIILNLLPYALFEGCTWWLLHWLLHGKDHQD